MEIKELPIKFIGRGEVKGFVFTQLKRSEDAYIFSVSPTGRYEVFTRQINRRFRQVRYPKAKDFGQWAWAPDTLKQALRIFDELSQNAKQQFCQPYRR